MYYEIRRDPKAKAWPYTVWRRNSDRDGLVNVYWTLRGARRGARKDAAYKRHTDEVVERIPA